MKAHRLATTNAADESKLMPKAVLNDSSTLALRLPIIELWLFYRQSLSTFLDKDCDFFDHITVTENLPIIRRLVFRLLFAMRSSLPPKADAVDPFPYRMEPQKGVLIPPFEVHGPLPKLSGLVAPTTRPRPHRTLVVDHRIGN